MEGSNWFQELPRATLTPPRRTYTPRNRRSASSRRGKRTETAAGEEEIASVTDIYVHFVENTQIPWIYYISSRDRVWKIIWLVIIVGGIAVAFVQSQTAFKGYTGYDVSLQTTYMLNSTLPFPSVTICTNSPIDWLKEESGNSSLYQEVMSRRNDEAERKKYESKFKRKGKLYDEYVLFDVLRKYPPPPHLTYGPVLSVTWDGARYTINGSAGNSLSDLESKKVVKLMRDLYYGDCFTFNAGVDDEEQLEASALTGVQFLLDWDAKDRYPELNDPSIVMVVHPAGVAPTFGDGNNFKIYSKDQVTVGIKEKEVLRLPSPYPSHCVPSERYPTRSNSAYFSDERKFYYSIDACINTCIQRLSLDICSCWDYLFPTGTLKNETKFQSASVCASRCSKIDSVLNIDRCKCNLPCREIALDLSFEVVSQLVTDIIKSDLGVDDKNQSIPTAAPVDKKTTIRVFLKTSMFEYTNEVPKYTVADFMGVVGGNVSFWIGISAVSLFEVVELGYQLGKYRFKRWKRHRKGIVTPLQHPYHTTVIRIPKILRSNKFSYAFHPQVVLRAYTHTNPHRN